jgi:hypothetical protein
MTLEDELAVQRQRGHEQRGERERAVRVDVVAAVTDVRIAERALSFYRGGSSRSAIPFPMTVRSVNC